MTESEFKRNNHAAGTLRHTGSDPVRFDYLLGYQRGLRRHYHGEKFGTAEEHELWLSLSEEQDDKVRQARGRGYRAGLAGTPIEKTEAWKS